MQQIREYYIKQRKESRFLSMEWHLPLSFDAKVRDLYCDIHSNTRGWAQNLDDGM